jgi:hypothetical protein
MRNGEGKRRIKKGKRKERMMIEREKRMNMGKCKDRIEKGKRKMERRWEVKG